MAVRKKHNKPNSSISGGYASGGAKPASGQQMKGSNHKKAAAPFKPFLSKVTALDRDTNTGRLISPKPSETVTDDLKLTIFSKEELENSRISAYRYIL